MKLRNIIAIAALTLPLSSALGQTIDKPFMIVDGDTVTKSYFD